MKKSGILLFLNCLIFVLLCACTNEKTEIPESESKVITTQHSSSVPNNSRNSLRESAMDILNEFDAPEVEDFLYVYNLLINIPSAEDEFIERIYKAKSIFEKYCVEFKYGGYYAKPRNTISITADGIKKYKTTGVYDDLTKLLKAIVYPVVFDEYGYAADKINGLTADSVVYAIESVNSYSYEDKEKNYDVCTETWDYIGASKKGYKFDYYANGVINNIEIPIVKSDSPMNNEEYAQVYSLTAQEQKEFAGKRFSDMVDSWQNFDLGYEVLSQIYSEVELQVIFNYIKSLSANDIFEKNGLAAGTSVPATYAVAMVQFNYADTAVVVNYDLNDIYLRISGTNYYNMFSYKWYTLYCGLCLPVSSSVDLYQNHLDEDNTSHNTVPEWSFNLDENEKDYLSETLSDMDYYSMSLSDKITVEGIVEENTDIFPNYRFKLNKPVKITLEEYGEGFYCEYLYFYDEPEINGGYNFSDFEGQLCTVTASVENYRGGGELYLLNPLIQSQ